MPPTVRILLLASLGAALAAGAVPAQRGGGGAAASARYFAPSFEFGSGGTCSSTTYHLQASFGSGVVASRATSTRYVLRGGYAATLDAPTTGKPWLAALRPLYAPLKGGTVLALRGTELALGTGTSVKVGGLPATVTSTSRALVRATLPAQPVPGWQPVELTNGGGRSALPRGLGVLPLIELVEPAQPGLPFTFVYRGYKGDIVAWFVALGRGSSKITLTGYGHGLEIDILTLFNPMTVGVPATDGVLRIPLPAGLMFPRPISVQALSLSTNPGTSPGSFTNTVDL